MDKVDGPLQYEFVLYVAGTGPRSSKTISNLRHICDRYLDGRHQLEVVDVRSSPERAEKANILITPTLVRQQPPPQRRVVGDLSDTQAVLYVLEMEMDTETQRKGDPSHELA